MRIYSPFQRFGPDGEVIAKDRVERPREILSPAVPKNAWLTLQIVVKAKPGTEYTLFMGQNPEDLTQYKVYQERYEQTDGVWVPDGLQPVKIPHGAKLDENQTCQSYLLEIFVPAGVEKERFRIEAQLLVDHRYLIAPMEVRVVGETLSHAAEPQGRLANLSDRIDTTLFGPVREYLCGAKPSRLPQQPDTLRAMVLRDIRQDLEMAQRRSAQGGAVVTQGMILSASGFGSLDEFCKSKQLPPRGAEWWLRARDYLYQGRPVH